jgi:hypothetical protein
MRTSSGPGQGGGRRRHGADGVVQERLTKAVKKGPSQRLLPTTSATTPRKAKEPLAIRMWRADLGLRRPVIGIRGSTRFAMNRNVTLTAPIAVAANHSVVIST